MWYKDRATKAKKQSTLKLISKIFGKICEHFEFIFIFYTHKKKKKLDWAFESLPKKGGGGRKKKNGERFDWKTR